MSHCPKNHLHMAILTPECARLVNTGKNSASQVVAAINTAKAALKAAGYSGPVATVDTMSKHPFQGFPSCFGQQSDLPETVGRGRPALPFCS